MKRVVSIAMALCLCLVCFVGCGNGGKNYEGWEDQTVDELSFKVPTTWIDKELDDGGASYYITKHSQDEEPDFLTDVSLSIYIKDEAVDDALESFTNYESKKIKIAGQSGKHIIVGETELGDEWIFEAEQYVFPISDEKTCAISILNPKDAEIEYNKEEVELFLDSIKINK